MDLLNAIRLEKSTTLRGNSFHMLTTRSAKNSDLVVQLVRRLNILYMEVRRYRARSEAAWKVFDLNQSVKPTSDRSTSVSCPGLTRMPWSSGNGIRFCGRARTISPAVLPTSLTYWSCCIFTTRLRPTNYNGSRLSLDTIQMQRHGVDKPTEVDFIYLSVCLSVHLAI